MAITYGFFNSVDHDRVYDADTISNMFKGLISDGVYASVGNALQVRPSSGLTIVVGSGRAIVDDRWVENSADAELTLNAPHVTLPRYTAIVLRKSTTARTVELIMVDGTPASTPVKPAVVRNVTTYDIVLAYVYVGAAASTITAANITDTRPDTSICGFVTGLIEQVDTSELFTQFETAYEEARQEMSDWEADQKAAFDTWYADLTEELNVDTYVERKSVTFVTTGSTRLMLLDASLEHGENDILSVYLNGWKMREDEYTVAVEGGSASILFEVSIPQGQVLYFESLKSKIGYQA